MRTTEQIINRWPKDILAIDLVEKIIIATPEPVHFADLKKVTGFSSRKLSNALYRALKIRSRIRRCSKGVYTRREWFNVDGWENIDGSLTPGIHQNLWQLLRVFLRKKYDRGSAVSSPMYEYSRDGNATGVNIRKGDLNFGLCIRRLGPYLYKGKDGEKSEGFEIVTYKTREKIRESDVRRLDDCAEEFGLGLRYYDSLDGYCESLQVVYPALVGFEDYDRLFRVIDLFCWFMDSISNFLLWARDEYYVWAFQARIISESYFKQDKNRDFNREGVTGEQF